MINQIRYEVNEILQVHSSIKIEKLLRGMQCNYFTEIDAHGYSTTEDWEDCFEIEQSITRLIVKYWRSNSDFLYQFNKAFNLTDSLTVKEVSIFFVQEYMIDNY
jgi:hypothetical protein